MASLFIACQLFAFHLQGMSVTESEGGSEGGSEGERGRILVYLEVSEALNFIYLFVS